METAVTHMNLKSFIARVSQRRRQHYKFSASCSNDGTPIKSVEVKVDEGPWQPATMDRRRRRSRWKLFNYC